MADSAVVLSVMRHRVRHGCRARLLGVIWQTRFEKSVARRERRRNITKVVKPSSAAFANRIARIRAGTIACRGLPAGSTVGQISDLGRC